MNEWNKHAMHFIGHGHKHSQSSLDTRYTIITISTKIHFNKNRACGFSQQTHKQTDHKINWLICLTSIFLGELNWIHRSLGRVASVLAHKMPFVLEIVAHKSGKAWFDATFFKIKSAFCKPSSSSHTEYSHNSIDYCGSLGNNTKNGRSLHHVTLTNDRQINDNRLIIW